MAAWTYESILNDLKAKKYFPVYFLCGDQPFFIDKLSDYLEDNLLDETARGFNQTVLYGKDLENNIAPVIEICRCFPMMGDKQVVIIKEAQMIKKLEDLDSYFKNPTRSTILVINYKGSPDKRKTFVKSVEKNGILYQTPVLYENNVSSWVNDHAKERGLIIEPAAVTLLVEYLGTDLQKISNSLDKLIINLKNKKTIDAGMVAENIGINKEYNAFELQKALQKKDVFKSTQIAKYFAGSTRGDSTPFAIVGILFSFYTKILIYHSLQDKSKSSVASALRISPFFTGDYEQAARNYNFQKTVNIISNIREYDMKMKGVDSTTSSGELLTELVLKILYI